MHGVKTAPVDIYGHFDTGALRQLVIKFVLGTLPLKPNGSPPIRHR